MQCLGQQRRSGSSCGTLGCHPSIVPAIRLQGKAPKSDSLLGVRYAQGYAICKPAAVEQLVSWVHGLHERIASPPGIRSTLAALAFAWKFRHAAAYRIRVDVDDCPLHGFFMQRGLRGSDVDLWHRQSHAAAEPAQRERASRAVRDWLSERVAESIAAASI